MKAFVAALAAIAIVSTGAWFALEHAGFSAAARGTGANVRLD
jgi:hypothetical protein